MEKVLLVDAGGLIHRAYHALPPLKKSDGTPTGAVYGFFLAFIKVLKEVSPERAVVAFDCPGKTFRHEKYEDYKAQRPETPQDLKAQFPFIKEGLEAFGVPAIEKEKHEADDVIATLTEKWKDQLEIIILSGDRDLLQLVDEGVKVRSPGRGIKEMTEFNSSKVKEKYGVLPSQIIDYKSLKGDSSDNIPGVKGIGKKRAADLLEDFESLEDIYSNLENISDSLREKLEKNKKEAFRSKELVELRTDLNLNISKEDSILSFNEREVIDFLGRLEFDSLKKKFSEEFTQMKLNLA